MKSINVRVGFCAVALLVLALPFGASAHPSLYNIIGKVASSPEIQEITISGATGGTFKPSAGATAVDFDAPAYAVQAALGADPAIGRNATTGQANVLVTGPLAGVYTLRFQGTRATTNEAQVVPDGGLLTGPGTPSATAATDVEGALPAITHDIDPDGGTLPDDVSRTTIPNDGYVMTFTESNGLATNGWLNLRFMPGPYRAPMEEEEWVTWPRAQTGIQSHATCQDAPGLNTVANILLVQSNETDPFWNYVPWQKTSSRLGDEPEQWIGVVDDAVGVDLSTLNTVDDFRTACEGVDGVYVPADNPAFPATNAVDDAVEAAVAPLNAMIDSLTNRPPAIQLQAQRSQGKVIAMVTGPLSEGATIQLRIKPGMAQNLGIPQVIDTTTKQLGAKGAVLVTLAPSGRAANRLSGRPAFDITVRAVSGGVERNASGKLRL